MAIDYLVMRIDSIPVEQSFLIPSGPAIEVVASLTSGSCLILSALILNRLDESANLAYMGLPAKFQPIWTRSLVRAMGVDKNRRCIL